jgi:concanavalin A-like lectin/glucanase superfamily protein
MNELGLDPKAWHHVAVTFDATINVLNLWLDGQHVAYLSVSGQPTGNAAAVDIGRKGPTTGQYWLGALDDIRIWNVARRGTDISATYRTEYATPQPGSSPTGGLMIRLAARPPTAAVTHILPP